MRVPSCCRAPLALVCLFVAGFFVRADETKIALDKLPKVVVDAVKARYPDAKLLSAVLETEDGKTFYEVLVQNKDQKIDVLVTPTGEITEVEKQIPVDKLPEKVSKAVEAKYPKATHKLVEEVYKVTKAEEKLTHYEVYLVTADKKSLEVYVAPDGKIIKEKEWKEAK
jgi:uncharacterized membrane protein YkoI